MSGLENSILRGCAAVNLSIMLSTSMVLDLFRAELALSTLALVAGCSSNMHNMVEIFGKCFLFMTASVSSIVAGFCPSPSPTTTPLSNP